MVFIVERNIQCVQKVWKYPNENVTHNFSEKNLKDRSIRFLFIETTETE
jgi:hypothetical protein